MESIDMSVTRFPCEIEGLSAYIEHRSIVHSTLCQPTVSGEEVGHAMDSAIPEKSRCSTLRMAPRSVQSLGNKLFAVRPTHGRI